MNLGDRKLIPTRESKVTYFQLTGIFLICIGILYLILKITLPFWIGSSPISSENIAVIFFIIMLGVAFTFPFLLEENEGLSTMRMVVFMMINVICLLLLKIGWEQESLKNIRLDEYWMGVIAFVFGAKATQAYFESALSKPKDKEAKIGTAALTFSNAEVAKLAVEQNQQALKIKFPNIITISDTVHDINNEESHVIAIYLYDNESDGIPDKLEVKMPDGSLKTINVEIIKGVSKGGILFSQKVGIYNTTGTHGSLCCLAKDSNGSNVAITSGHIYTKGYSIGNSGWLSGAGDANLADGAVLGSWSFLLINQVQDIAAIRLNGSIPNDMRKFPKGCYLLNDKDVKRTQVTLLSSMKKERTGYILDYNLSWPVPYLDYTVSKSSIILIGSTQDRDSSMALSEKGDSGGCVYHSDSGQLIGIILGGDKKFTWALPVKDTLDFWGFELI